MWIVFVLFLVPALAQVDPDDEEAAREWLEGYNTEAQVRIPVNQQARWDYSTNITDYNLQRSLEEAAILAGWDLSMYTEAMQWNWQDFENEATVREFAKITDIGTAVLEGEDLERLEAWYLWY